MDYGGVWHLLLKLIYDRTYMLFTECGCCSASYVVTRIEPFCFSFLRISCKHSLVSLPWSDYTLTRRT